MMLDTPEGEDAPADLVSSVSATSGELGPSCAESEEASVPCGSPLGAILGVVSPAGAACAFPLPSHSSLPCFSCWADFEELAPAAETEPAPRLAAFA